MSLEKYAPLVLPVAQQGNMGENSEGTDFEGLMIDASHVKVHPDARRYTRRKSEEGPYNRLFNK